MLYLKLTGTYFFFDSNIPIAVFLGMHLLFTDPSTSPRTELGRIIFGVLYGASVVGLYWLLGRLGAPTFYDKLLQVPIMNLMVRRIDRIAESASLAWLNPERLGSQLAPRMRSLGYVSLWIVVFTAMSYTKGVGDSHEGHTIPFWYQACNANRPNACYNYGALLNGDCGAQSGWACNELGILIGSGRLHAVNKPAELFAKACQYGQKAGCGNAKILEAGQTDFAHGDPVLPDFQVLLRQGKPLAEKTPFQIYTRACDEGWMAGCDGLAGMYFMGGPDLLADKPRAAALAERACTGGNAHACSNLGLMYKNGDGVPRDEAKALDCLKRACDLGMAQACTWLRSEREKSGRAVGPPR
jgi:hypothetical protein